MSDRRTSDGWLYAMLAAGWLGIFGGVGLMVWGDGRLGLAALAIGLFILVFEVGLLSAGRAAWLGMRLQSLAGERAARRREARRQGREAS